MTYHVRHPVLDRFNGRLPSGTSSTPAVGGTLPRIDPVRLGCFDELATWFDRTRGEGMAVRLSEDPPKRC
jgi:hypothetical protein